MDHFGSREQFPETRHPVLGVELSGQWIERKLASFVSPVNDDLLVAENSPQQRERTNRVRVIEEITTIDERIDFHSLRHTCATWLIHAGADVKTIQSVMRHADTNAVGERR